jgi:hypothetical protein
VIRLLGWLVVGGYLIYGIRRFYGLFTSPRFVQRAPKFGFWTLSSFWDPNVWTPEGRSRRNQLLAWQAGLVVLVALINLLY